MNEKMQPLMLQQQQQLLETTVASWDCDYCDDDVDFDVDADKDGKDDDDDFDD